MAIKSPLSITKFGGIDLRENAPPNTFQELMNIRTDIQREALVSRPGIKSIYSLGDIQPKVFAINKFKLGERLIFLSDDTIFSVEDLDEQTDLTSSHLTTVKGTVTTVLEINGTVPAFSLQYTICYNATLGKYAVALSQADTFLTMNKDVSGWGAADVIRFSRNDLFISESNGGKFFYSLTGTPKLTEIDGFGNLLLSGISDSVRGVSPWIGDIYDIEDDVVIDRSFFDGFVTYRGLYVSGVTEDFTYGAFNKDEHHISTAIVDDFSASETEVLSPNSTIGSTNVTLSGAATIHEALSDTSDSSYIIRTSSGAWYAQVGLTAPTNRTASSKRVSVSFVIGAGDIGFYVSLYDALGLLVTVSEVLTNDSVTHSVWVDLECSRVPDLDTLEVKFGNTLTVIPAAQFMKVTTIVYFANSTSVPIVQPDASIYNVNIALLLDNFNQTRLLYDAPYGEIVSSSTYGDSIIVSGAPANGKYIGVKIRMKYPELITRRCTEILVYATRSDSYSPTLFSEKVWRFCNRFKVKDLKLTYNATTLEYETVVYIGNEINTGELYESQQDLVASYESVKTIPIFTHTSRRSYFVWDKEPNIVHYSPINDFGFATGVLPLSNFVTFTGFNNSIKHLHVISDTVVVFRESSHHSISDLSTKLVSSEVGLAGINSIANAETTSCFFISYTGIYLTDGFKSQLVSGVLTDYFGNYTKEQLESSLGFYDTHHHAYHAIIPTGDDTYDMWVFETITGNIHRESFLCGDDDEYGYPSLIAKKLDGRSLFTDTLSRAGEDKQSIFEYPREDGLFTDGVVDGEVGSELPISATLRLNPVDEQPVDEAYYLDDAYIKSTPLVSSAVLSIYSGTTLEKAVTGDIGRTLIPLKLKKSLSSFDAKIQFSSTVKQVISEIGFYFKSMRKSGSQKQYLNS